MPPWHLMRSFGGKNEILFYFILFSIRNQKYNFFHFRKKCCTFFSFSYTNFNFPMKKDASLLRHSSYLGGVALVCCSLYVCIYCWCFSLHHRSVISSSRFIRMHTNPHSYAIHCVLFVVRISFHIRWHSNNIQLGMCGAAMCVGTNTRHIQVQHCTAINTTIDKNYHEKKAPHHHTKLRIDSNTDEWVSEWSPFVSNNGTNEI